QILDVDRIWYVIAAATTEEEARIEVYIGRTLDGSDRGHFRKLHYSANKRKAPLASVPRFLDIRSTVEDERARSQVRNAIAELFRHTGAIDLTCTIGTEDDRHQSILERCQEHIDEIDRGRCGFNDGEGPTGGIGHWILAFR